ncbi:hypothetical protein [Thermofilum sp.]|uniref:hypothetical protein n=1 Tax=Thermofilum sp. TaxID=1961369 RepID=UPI00319E96C0
MIPEAVLEKVEKLEKELLERGWYCHGDVCVRTRDVVGVRVSRVGGGYVVTFYLSDYRAVRIVLSESGDVKEITMD